MAKTFYDIDKDLFFGVGYKYLHDILKNLGVLFEENEEENLEKIYGLSKYRRKIN